MLRQRGIEPQEQIMQSEFPDVGELAEGETIYSTSVAEVFGELDEEDSVFALDEDRLGDWWQEIEVIIRSGGEPRPRQMPPEPHCAWYCPIHLYVGFRTPRN